MIADSLIRYYCSCGAGMEGRIGIQETRKEEILAKIKAFWEQEHSGPGHSSCTKVEAALGAIHSDIKEIMEKED